MSDIESYNLGNAYQDYKATLEVSEDDGVLPLSGAPGFSSSSLLAPTVFNPESLGSSTFLRGANSETGVERFLGGFAGESGIFYNSYAGTDIVAQIVLPNEEPLMLGELHTLSYSTHRENMPVRALGHTNAVGHVRGNRTIAGSLIFMVFNNYAFYRLKHMQNAINHNLYPVADMLPPFDIVLTFANESGALSKMKIFGVTIIDEGGTMSIDDLVIESTYSFLARGIQPMTGYYIREDESNRLGGVL